MSVKLIFVFILASRLLLIVMGEINHSDLPDEPASMATDHSDHHHQEPASGTDHQHHHESASGTTNHSDHHHHHEPALVTSRSHVDERHHIEHHMSGVTGQDISQMGEDELQFHYFKMHDTDNNDKLDGCELVKSLLHFHIEEHNAMVPDASIEGTTRIFGHDELALMIDPIISSDDKDSNGFIDYLEFTSAQKSRGF